MTTSKRVDYIIRIVHKSQVLMILFISLFFYGLYACFTGVYWSSDVAITPQEITSLLIILSSSLTGFSLLLLWKDMKMHFPFLNLEKDHTVFFIALSMAIWAVNSFLFLIGEGTETIRGIANVLNTGTIVTAFKFVYFRSEDKPEWLENSHFRWLRRGRILLAVIIFTILLSQVVYYFQDSFLPNIGIHWNRLPALVFGLYCLVYIYKMTVAILNLRGFKIFIKYFNLIILPLVGLGQILLILNSKQALHYSLSMLYVVGLQTLFMVIIISWYNYLRQESNTNLVRQMNHAVKDSLTVLESDLIRRSDAAGEAHSREEIRKASQRVAAIREMHDYLHGSDFLKFVENIHIPRNGEDEYGNEKGKTISINLMDFFRHIFTKFSTTNELSEREFEYKLPADRRKVWLVLPKAQMIGIVLAELNNNALEACRTLPNHQIHIQNIVELKGEQLNLEVIDNGPGYETKTENGFGLSIIYTIIEHYGGTIDFEQREEGGTKCTIKNISIPNPHKFN